MGEQHLAVCRRFGESVRAGQPTRHHRSRRARSANNEVVLGFQARAELPLIGTNPLGELGCGTICFVGIPTHIRSSFRCVGECLCGTRSAAALLSAFRHGFIATPVAAMFEDAGVA
jgi:hypothetical protein